MGNSILYAFAKIYWFLFRPKTFGARCIVECDGKILMIKHSYGGWKKWMFPGGGIDKNETAEEAVKREVFEEVGLSLVELRRIGKYTSTKEFKRDMVMVFAGQSKDKNIKIDQKEIAEATWFELNNLPEISEYSKEMLVMWQKHNKRYRV